MSKTNVLIMGPIGSGKTTALRTVVEDTTKTLFVLSLEPGIDKILTHSDRCHWHYIPPALTDWTDLIREAELVNTMSIDQLQKMKPNRAQYRQYIELLQSCNDFTCTVCGQSFGDTEAFGEDVVLACDGLSGLNIMAMDIVAGGNPVKTLTDYQIAMNNVERFIQKMCVATKCSFVLTAHIERETDEVMGGTKITVSTIGKKMSPRLPRFFDEVVCAVHRGKEYWWSTIEGNTDLKQRVLPLSDEIPPTFAQLLNEENTKC